MHTVSTITDVRGFVQDWKRVGLKVAFVPTMGNLHQGHFSLIETAKRHADRVVASIYVNPTQFGPKEDFASYPRTPEADQDGLQQAGCDLVFMPSNETLYPFGSAESVMVSVPDRLTKTLCGLTRPGHFTGVATVVSKLFNIVQPDAAVFGMKDFQQVMVIRRMVADMAMPIEVIGAPTLREANGLAMSSRNQYLTPEERERAGVIYESLIGIREGLKAGKNLVDLRQQAWDRLEASGLKPDYVEIRRAEDLQHAGDEPDVRMPLVVLIAARFGKARLIDNLNLA